ncbi:MAG: metallophosphoesterase [Steroidobacteraceae bacterium]|jgi:hypothetical protein|nr:metallophosphoesterase [Steroidobacteraceae bacterium]
MFAAAGAGLLLGICAVPAAGQPLEAAPALDGVGRIVAVSDLHGAHRAFVETLQSAGVLDAAERWAGGRTHLVVLGDVVDRGDDSRASLDLLMALEGQAAAAGGRVHVVLGNHDVMNLTGDLRYVTKGEFAAFASEETAEQRDAAYEKLAARVASRNLALTRTEFDSRFPPGFFVHRAAFSGSGRYGRWLSGKPLALRINDTLFIHAGLSEALPDPGLAAINGALRDDLLQFLALRDGLTARGTLDPTIDFHEIPEALGAVDDEAAAAHPDPLVRRLLALRRSAIHSPVSPLWYRGNAGCGPLVEQDRLARLLQSVGARRVVIGHTPTHQRQAWRRLSDRVWMIDTGMQRDYYSGKGAALVLDGGAASVIYQGASQPVPVEELPARAGALSANLTPGELEVALSEGEIIARSATPAGEVLTLKWRGVELEAVFRPAPGARGPFPEVAAYRVDQMLDLAMVPAAVVRSVDGRAGSAQHLPPGLVPEARRAAGEVRVEAWCPLNDQWQAMRLFDALIANATRAAVDVQYLAGSGQVVLTGHQAAFGTDPGIPSQFAGAGLAVNPAWRQRLAGLETAEARGRLLEVLSRRQYEALLGRARALARK